MGVRLVAKFCPNSSGSTEDLPSMCADNRTDGCCGHVRLYTLTARVWLQVQLGQGQRCLYQRRWLRPDRPQHRGAPVHSAFTALFVATPACAMREGRVLH